MYVRLLFGVLLLWQGTRLVNAQATLDVLLRAPVRMTAAEFFIGRDPGKGLGTPIELPEAGDVTRLEYSTGNLKLAPGAHEVYFRFRDQHGHWGHPLRHSLFVMPHGFQTPTRIQGGEYFIDQEPGIDRGTPFSLTDDGQSPVGASVDTADLKLGGHVLYYRLQDSRGEWLPTSRHTFFTTPVFEATHVSYHVGDNEMLLDGGVVPVVPNTFDLGHATVFSASLNPEDLARNWFVETQIVLNGGIPWLTTNVPLEISAESVEPFVLTPLPEPSPDLDSPAVVPTEVVMTLLAPRVVGLGSTLTLGLEQPIREAVQVEQSGNLRDWFEVGILEPGVTELSVSVGVGSRFFRLVPIDSSAAPETPVTPPLP